MQILIRTRAGNERTILVDECDADLVRNHNWSFVSAPNTYYAKYMKMGVCYYLHREIMNAPPGMSVDHINGNGLDNRRENLRIVTHGENMRKREGRVRKLTEN